jgi:hypothetical protein
LQIVEGGCSEALVGFETYVELGLGVEVSGATVGAGDSLSNEMGGYIDVSAGGTGCITGEGTSGNNADGLIPSSPVGIDGFGDGVCFECGLESSCGNDPSGSIGISAVGLEVLPARTGGLVCIIG